MSKPTNASIAAAYRTNEENNSFSENLAMLANNFGTREDKMIADFNLTLRDSIGYRSPQMASVVDAMQARLFENIRTEYEEAKAFEAALNA